MRMTLARLRLWILVLAGLLLAALAGFLGYARYRAHRLIADLPGKLGYQISRSSSGFTYSQSVKGRTAFTIHASSAVQYKGGASATLRDVVITLYGAQGDRSDRISGSEFDYDQKAGIVTAKGEVTIDLQGADLAGAPAAAAPAASNPSAVPSAVAAAAAAAGVPAAQQVVHIKTSGLTFNQKDQIATTTQHVEFSTPKGAGQANGATYDVQKGLLVLQSAVELTSDRDGRPVVVHASHVEFLRPSMQAFLLNPVARYQTEQTAADQAIVYFHKDGSADHIDAQGNIHVKTDAGQELTCGAAKVALDLKGQPQSADLSGGINYASLGQADNKGPGRRSGSPQQMHGSAVEATVRFAPGGILSHAQARTAVSFVDQQVGLSDDAGGSATRELRASQVDADFAQDANGHAQAQRVLAAGGATAVLHTIRSKSAPQNTTIKGDQLLATLEGGHTMTSLQGTGHTSVLDLSPNGATNLSSGDTLLVRFTPPATKSTVPVKRQTGKGGVPDLTQDSTQIQSVVQEGDVVIVQTAAAADDKAAPKGGKPQQAAATTKAYARRADYDAAAQLLRLTGSPRVDDGTVALAADAIDYHRDTQAAEAVGNVKATYGETAPASSAGKADLSAPAPGLGGSGPTHVIAANALLDRAHGVAVFRGQARLWQGPNSVAAPVIELTRSPESLKAYAEPAATDAVTTVLASTSGPQRQATVLRVRSRQMTYTDADRKAVFAGAVAADDPSGVVHADQVVALLLPAPAPGQAAPAAAQNPSQIASQNPGQAPNQRPSEGAGRIDRILATGHVALQQPGRRGVGEKLLYTAQDGKFELTGTPSTPPHLYDHLRGDVSGASLIFNSRDDSVSVSGGQSPAVTNTRTAK